MGDPHIGFMLKMCRKKSHAEDVLSGKLHCPPIASYRDDDPLEGVSHFPRERMAELAMKWRVTIPGKGGMDLHPTDIKISHPEAGMALAFCVFAWYIPTSNGLYHVNIEDQIGSLLELYKSYGTYGVLISPRAIEKRMDWWARSRAYQRGPVIYDHARSIPTGTRWGPYLDAALRKSPKYAHEKEYRFAFAPEPSEKGSPVQVIVRPFGAQEAWAVRPDAILDALKVDPEKGEIDIGAEALGW